MVELKGIRTPDLLHAMHACFVFLPRAESGYRTQSRYDVWGRLAQSGEIWGRWSLVWSWFA